MFRVIDGYVNVISTLTFLVILRKKILQQKGFVRWNVLTHLSSDSQQQVLFKNMYFIKTSLLELNEKIYAETIESILTHM